MSSGSIDAALGRVLGTDVPAPEVDIEKLLTRAKHAAGVSTEPTKPASLKIGPVFTGPERAVVVSAPVTTTDVDAMAAAVCSKFMELCTTFSKPPPGTQFEELGENGKNIWRAISRAGLDAIGAEWELETGSVWTQPENASQR